MPQIHDNYLQSMLTVCSELIDAATEKKMPDDMVNLMNLHGKLYDLKESGKGWDKKEMQALRLEINNINKRILARSDWKSNNNDNSNKSSNFVKEARGSSASNENNSNNNSNSNSSNNNNINSSKSAANEEKEKELHLGKSHKSKTKESKSKANEKNEKKSRNGLYVCPIESCKYSTDQMKFLNIHFTENEQHQTEWNENQCTEPTCKKYLKYFPTKVHKCTAAPRKYLVIENGANIGCPRCLEVIEILPLLYDNIKKKGKKGKPGLLKGKKAKEPMMEAVCEYAKTKPVYCPFRQTFDSSKPYSASDFSFEKPVTFDAWILKKKQLLGLTDTHENDRGGGSNDQ